MRKSWAHLYAPFLALAMIQAALVLVHPPADTVNDPDQAALEVVRDDPA
jgi:hypothetical protein